MRSSKAASSLPVTNPRKHRNATKDYGYVRDIVNAVLLLIALALAFDLLSGRRRPTFTQSGDKRITGDFTKTSRLSCARPVRLHNAFSLLCRQDQPGVVYSARFGGLGGWEVEVIHSGDFATEFHVFDPTPLVSERQLEIEYHPLGLGLTEETITLAPPGRPEHTYSFLGNQSSAKPHDKSLSVNGESFDTLMRQFGHSHLAMLHLDLGGMETLLVDGWVQTRSRPAVDQIVIRFSMTPFPLPGQEKPIQATIENMWKIGFRLFDERETEYTFVQEDAVEASFWGSKQKP